MARRGAHDLQLVERQPIPVQISLVATDGTRWTCNMHLRPFSLRDESWLVERQDGTDWTDRVLDADDAQILIDMYAHQLVDEDRQELCARLGLEETTWEALASALLDKIAADPQADPQPVKVLMNAVLQARSASWPDAVLVDEAAGKKKVRTKSRLRRWTEWSCVFALGCAAGWLISSTGLPDSWWPPGR